MNPHGSLRQTDNFGIDPESIRSTNNFELNMEENNDPYEQVSRLDSIVADDVMDQPEIKSNSGGEAIENMSPLYEKSPIAEN